MGRTADLGEIAARLARYPVLTLTGVGGVGKTALAVEAAWAEVPAGRADLACYADLVPCRGGEQVVAALVGAAGIRGAEAAAGLDAVAGAVSGRRSLLVVDNCEHVLEAARRACELLAGRARRQGITITARQLRSRAANLRFMTTKAAQPERLAALEAEWDVALALLREALGTGSPS